MLAVPTPAFLSAVPHSSKRAYAGQMRQMRRGSLLISMRQAVLARVETDEIVGRVVERIVVNVVDEMSFRNAIDAVRMLPDLDVKLANSFRTLAFDVGCVINSSRTAWAIRETDELKSIKAD